MKFAAFALVVGLCLVAVTAIATEEQTIEFKDYIPTPIKCLIIENLKIIKLVEQFKADIKVCKGEINKGKKELFKSIDEVTEVAYKIDEIYNVDCKKGENLGIICNKNLSKAAILFGAKVAETGKQLLGIINDFGDFNKCLVNAAVDDLVDYFVKYPIRFYTCQINFVI